MRPLTHKIGTFEILHKIGRGGMADVYLATDSDTSQTVALKIIEYGTDIDSQEAIAAEKRGTLLQKALGQKDPHVVQIYRWGDLDGYFFVAMEYIAGEDLAEHIQRSPLPPDRAAAIAAEICTTLQNAHTLDVTVDGKEFHGIVHGDVKPRNVRIATDQRVRVIDFGIAKALSLSRRLTRNEFGSIPYASPERLDTGDVDAHSDLWSVGVILYEMISGRQPYYADSTQRAERLIRNRAPFAPLPDTCPLPLRSIVDKALAPYLYRRYDSAGSMRDDLLSFLRGAPVKAMVEDRDATMRTQPRQQPNEQATDETRRTVNSPPPQQPPRHTQGKRRSPFLNLDLRPGKLLLWTVVIVLAYTAFQLFSGYLLWSHGRDLVNKIHAERISDPDQIWTEWQKVAKSSSGSILLFSARHTVRDELQDAAERVIQTYRTNETQPVYENDWERARRSLVHALELDPGDDKIRGELRLCEGHLARINGTARRSTAQLNEAIAKFQDAAKLLRNSPDPDLGLARVYIYGLKDVEKADAALQAAKKHGYKLGNREKSQLADGYRDRADRMWSDSRSLVGLPQEKDMLERCIDNYERAMELYEGIAPYGNASTNVARVQASLDRVNKRIENIEDSRWP